MADELDSLSVDTLKEVLHERGVIFKRSAPRADLEALYRMHVPTPMLVTKAAGRPKSPGRPRKSMATSEPPTPQASEYSSHHQSASSKRSPGTASLGGLRLVSVSPLRPDSTDALFAADVPAAMLTKPASPRRGRPPGARSGRGGASPRRASRAASPPRVPTPPPVRPSSSADESTPEQPPLPREPIQVYTPAAIVRQREEAQSSDYSRLFFSAIIIAEIVLTVVVLHFGLAFYSAITTPPNFCDTGVQGPDCIPCPPNGVCSNGALTCDEGFVQHGVTCIEDERVTRLAFRAGSTLRAHLRQLDGDAVCTGGSIPVTIADDAAKVYVERRQAAPLVTQAWERLMRRATEMELIFENGVWSTSASPARSFSCQFSLLIRENLLKIVLACVVLVLALWAYVWQAREGRNSELVQATFLEALTQLAENPGQPFAVSHVRDQVARRGTPQAVLWRRVEEAVEGDSRVGKAQQVLNGIQTTTWQWQAGPLSPRRSLYR